MKLKVSRHHHLAVSLSWVLFLFLIKLPLSGLQSFWSSYLSLFHWLPFHLGSCMKARPWERPHWCYWTNSNSSDWRQAWKYREHQGAHITRDWLDLGIKSKTVSELQCGGFTPVWDAVQGSLAQKRHSGNVHTFFPLKSREAKDMGKMHWISDSETLVKIKRQRPWLIRKEDCLSLRTLYRS